MSSYKDTWTERDKSLGERDYKSFLTSEYWKNIKEKASKRIIYQRCEFCGSMDNIELHHKHYRMVGDTHELNAIIPVCRDHHQFIHDYAKTKDVSVEDATKTCYRLFDDWRMVPRSIQEYKDIIIKRNGTPKSFDKYIVKSTSNKSKAHVWDGNDTLCKMWSTNGIVDKQKYERVEETNRKICGLCLSRVNK